MSELLEGEGNLKDLEGSLAGEVIAQTLSGKITWAVWNRQEGARVITYYAYRARVEFALVMQQDGRMFLMVRTPTAGEAIINGQVVVDQLIPAIETQVPEERKKAVLEEALKLLAPPQKEAG